MTLSRGRTYARTPVALSIFPTSPRLHPDFTLSLKIGGVAARHLHNPRTTSRKGVVGGEVSYRVNYLTLMHGGEVTKGMKYALSAILDNGVSRNVGNCQHEKVTQSWDVQFVRMRPVEDVDELIATLRFGKLVSWLVRAQFGFWLKRTLACCKCNVTLDEPADLVRRGHRASEAKIMDLGDGI